MTEPLLSLCAAAVAAEAAAALVETAAAAAEARAAILLYPQYPAQQSASPCPAGLAAALAVQARRTRKAAAQRIGTGIMARPLLGTLGGVADV